MLAQNVKRGAAWLDENVPGWATRINTDGLRMQFDDECICGQLGIVKLPRVTEDRAGWVTNYLAYDYGLGFVIDFDEDEGDDAWSELDELWCNEVEARL